MSDRILHTAADALANDTIAERLVRALDAGDDAALNRLVRDNPAAQDALILLTLQAETVRQLAGAARNAERRTANAERPIAFNPALTAPRTPPHTPTLRPPKRLALAAALLLAAAALATYVYAIRPQPDAAPAAPARSVIATVTDLDGVRWQSEPLYPGDDVATGPIRTSGGQMALQLRSGAALEIAGVCDLSLDSSMRVGLIRGFVRFDCPASARGFTVRVPGGARVVDLGTRFAVATDGAGRTRVYVEDGRVELHGVDGSVTPLSVGGRGVIVDGRIERESPLAASDLSPIEATISPVSPRFTFTAASDDLLQTAASAIELGGGAKAEGVFGGQSIDALTNGPAVWYPDPRQTFESWSADDGGSLAWMLDIDAAPFGYDLDRIAVLAGCWPNRIGHVYRIEITTIDGDRWIELTDVNLPDNESSSSGEWERQVMIARRDGEPLATGVTAIRFTFRDDDPRGGNLGQSVYREIDVIGRPAGVIRSTDPDQTIDPTIESEPR